MTKLERFAQECPQFGIMLAVVKKKVCKDHKQRWIYRAGENWAAISDVPIPHHDKVSVYWMPIVEAVNYDFSPKAEIGLGHLA